MHKDASLEGPENALIHWIETVLSIIVIDYPSGPHDVGWIYSTSNSVQHEFFSVEWVLTAIGEWLLSAITVIHVSLVPIDISCQAGYYEFLKIEIVAELKAVVQQLYY